MKQILKYIGVFIITLLTLIILQHLAISIPNKYIEKNMIETVKYYEGQENHELLLELENSPKYLNKSLIIDNYTDCLTLNMLWNTDTTEVNKWKQQVLMPYYYNGYGTMSENLKETVVNNKLPNTEYSRYWHGSMIYLKPLLVFFNIKQIKIINCIIIILLTIYLLKLIYKKSKKLFMSFIIGLLSIGYFVIPFCFEYYFAFLIMLISSIVTMKILKKDDKYFYYLMIISGILICFMDFLTCETITLVIPLLLKLYFDKKKTTKEKFIFIIKSCLCWGLSYAITFASKWIISALVIGAKSFVNTWNKAKIRIYEIPIIDAEMAIPKILLTTISILFPFNIIKDPVIIPIVTLLFVIWFYVFSLSKKTKAKYSLLLLICLIPLARLTILFAHTAGHYFFDYRALLPIAIVASLIIITGIKKEIKNLKKGKRDEK